MSEETNETPCVLQDLTGEARRKLAGTQAEAASAIAGVTGFVRSNPWMAIAGATLLGGLIVAMGKSRKDPSANLDAVRDWLDDAYSRLPDKGEAKTGVRKLFRLAGKTFHNFAQRS